MSLLFRSTIQHLMKLTLGMKKNNNAKVTVMLGFTSFSSHSSEMGTEVASLVNPLIISRLGYHITR